MDSSGTKTLNTSGKLCTDNITVEYTAPPTAKEPYIEETYDTSGNLTGAIFHGHTKVRDWAFYSNGGITTLTSVSIPNTVTNIGQHAFGGCKNMALSNLPNAISSIGREAFSSCSSITIDSIPSAINILEVDTFSGCTGLVNLEIACKQLKGSVFNSCTGLRKVWIRSSCTKIIKYVNRCPFYYCDSSLVLYCEPDDYRDMDDWAYDFNSTKTATLTSIWGQKTRPW